MVDVEAAWGPNTTPNFTDSATLPTQALDPHAKPRLRRDPVAEEWTSAECEPAGSLPYSSGVSPAWDPSPTQVQQASRSKTTTMTKKKKKEQTKKPEQTHTRKKEDPHTGTATGQRSPEAPALYGCTKPHQAQTTPRHRQDGSRKGKGVSHFRYNCKRDIKEDGLWSARSLAYFFFLFLFLN